MTMELCYSALLRSISSWAFIEGAIVNELCSCLKQERARASA
jgi:hypothetical protein